MRARHERHKLVSDLEPFRVNYITTIIFRGAEAVKSKNITRRVIQTTVPLQSGPRLTSQGARLARVRLR